MGGYDYLRELAIILFFAKIAGVIARKLHAPEVVGEIICGLIIGPAIFGIVTENDFISAMSEIGVIMLMFEAGLNTNMKKLRQTGVKATVVACSGVAVPLVMGTILYMSFYGFGSFGSSSFNSGLFLGTVMTATSVSITVAALKEMGKLNGTVGTTITSAAIIDDVIGIIVLTLVMGISDSSGTSFLGIAMIILKVFLFFAVAAAGGYIVFRMFAKLDSKDPHARRVPISALAFCLIMSYIAEEYFGVADITGAYIAGVILCNLHDAEYIERRVDISAYMVFGPIFFAGIGLKVSFSSMSLKLLLFSLAFVIVAMVGKVIGCGGVAKLAGSNSHDAIKIGLGMMTRGEVALITAQKGLSMGLITSDFFTPVILLILFSSIFTPMLLKNAYSKYPAD